MNEKSKYKIFIDTSDRKNSKVILYIEEGQKDKELSRKEECPDVVTVVKEILNENHITLSDLAAIESNLGPGSFTGLRVGVTVSNILNWILGRKKIDNLDYPEYGREPNITPPKKFKL